MGAAFWWKRFAAVLAIAFAVITAGQFAQGRPLLHALTEAAIWAPIAAAIFVAVGLYRFRRAMRCPACESLVARPASASAPPPSNTPAPPAP